MRSASAIPITSPARSEVLLDRAGVVAGGHGVLLVVEHAHVEPDAGERVEASVRNVEEMLIEATGWSDEELREGER